MAKIDPRVRTEALAKSPDLVLVQVVSKTSVNPEQYFTRSFTRAMEGMFAEDGTPSDDAWERRVRKFLDEIEWYAEALASQREKKGVPYP